MGLAIDIEFKKTGIVMGYWRINMVSVDILLDQTILRIDGYISKAEALLANSPLEGIQRTYVGSQNPIGLMTDPREYQNILYSKLIEAPAMFMHRNIFEGATIVSDLP